MPRKSKDDSLEIRTQEKFKSVSKKEDKRKVLKSVVSSSSNAMWKDLD